MHFMPFAITLALLLAACGSAPETETPVSAPRAEREVIYPPEFPRGKPYSPGILAGKTLYIAGQVSLDPKTGEQPQGVEAQTHMAMDNLGHVLRAAGMDYSNLVKCHVQLDDMDNYQAMNAIYGSYFEEGRYPARTTLEMPALPGGASLEVTCIGYADKEAIEAIRPEEGTTPAAMGPYSPAVLAGDTLYLSGQGGRDPATNEVPDEFEAQVRQTLQTIGAILEAAGLGFSQVANANVYYLGPQNGPEIDGPLMEFFEAGNAPSRGDYCLSRLPGTISAELTFIASTDRYMTRLFPPGAQPDSAWSPATLASDTLYVSAASAPEAGETFEAQFRALMETQEKRLAMADLNWTHVVSVNVYLADLGDMESLNSLYNEYFPQNPPVRTTVGVRLEGPQQGTRVQAALIAMR